MAILQKQINFACLVEYLNRTFTFVWMKKFLKSIETKKEKALNLAEASAWIGDVKLFYLGKLHWEQRKERNCGSMVTGRKERKCIIKKNKFHCLMSSNDATTHTTKLLWCLRIAWTSSKSKLHGKLITSNIHVYHDNKDMSRKKRTSAFVHEKVS